MKNSNDDLMDLLILIFSHWYYAIPFLLIVLPLLIWIANRK